jgi:hypothetical protein
VSELLGVGFELQTGCGQPVATDAERTHVRINSQEFLEHVAGVDIA